MVGMTTTLAPPVRVPVTVSRRYLAAGTFIALGVIDIFVFGLFAHRGDAVFALSLPGAKPHVPSIRVPGAAAAYVAGAISIGLGVLRAAVDLPRWGKRLFIAIVLLCFLVALLSWADAGNSVGSLQVVDLLQGTLTASIPLVLGALAGLLGERSGVINIAIEGQLLLGAFTAAAVASVTGGVWLGLLGGSLAGGLVGALLAIFAIMFLVDQIIVGVVLNVIALGLTNYLYNRVMAPYAATFNAGNTFGTVKIPVLGNIPIIGPVFFDSNVFLYITYALILVIQIALFRTRWGLRVRAVGEHPTAADTVGIRVLWTRYRNVILGGLVAGIGGAYLTVGSVGFFTSDISSGFGYIALAAMIFGRWTPLGSVAAALLFGFSFQLQTELSVLRVPVSSFILLMAPYVATIIAVAGLVGRVRPPAADGKPYVKA
jgi:general nucleoside transport system permease protein